jgi:toxin co-regulated pilin
VKEQIYILKNKANAYKKFRKQRGMSLLEVIIVLGIVGTIAAGVVVLAQRAFSSQAITQLVSNTNSIRLAAQEAYRKTGYPAPSATATVNMTPTTILAAANAKVMIASLVQLGKLSESEAKNGISGDYFHMGGTRISTGTSAGLKGFFLSINGLDQAQCRNIITQIGNQWDYVGVVAAASGVDAAGPSSLDATLVAGVLRSLHASGNVTITPAATLAVCADTSHNAVVLGSR